MPWGLGQNLPRAKQINRALILEQVLFHGPMSRQQIAQNLGLTSATITNFVSKLIREGLLCEVGFVEEDRIGRKSAVLALRDDRYTVMAIHLRGSDMEIGFVGLQGMVSVRRLVPYPAALNKFAFLRFIRDQVNIQLESRGKRDVVAVGVGSRGALNAPPEEVLVVSPDRRIDTVALQQVIQSYLNLPVTLRSNAVGMALAEKMYGACKQDDNFLLIYMGPNGIGSGLVFNGESYQGTGISTLGLGHMMYAPEGPGCSCGRNGCLELYASELAIQEAAGLSSSGELHERIRDGDVQVLRVLEGASQKISVVLSSFLSLIDLHHIILGGGVTADPSPLVRLIRESINDRSGIYHDRSIQVSASALGTDLGIVGAAAPAIFEHVIRGNEFPEEET